MGIIVKPNTFTASTTASSSEVNANFDTIYNEFNGNIAAANLATNAVTTNKIADSNVTTDKIADSNVTTAKVADGAITTAKVADAAVTSAKWTNPYTFRAYKSSNSAMSSGSTVITFDTENFDISGNYNSSNGQFTAPVDGVYQFSVTVQATNGPEYLYAGLLVNSALAAAGSTLDLNGVGSSMTGVYISTVTSSFLLTAGDIVTARVTSDDSGTLIGSSFATFFGGHLVTET